MLDDVDLKEAEAEESDAVANTADLQEAAALAQIAKALQELSHYLAHLATQPLDTDQTRELPTRTEHISVVN